MADEQDLEDLRLGEVDMARRDFRNADISGLDASNRDFAGAHFEAATAHKTNFFNSSLIGAHFLSFQSRGGNFDRTSIYGTVFVHTNLDECSFRNADLQRSHFSNSSIQRADLRGANFTKAIIGEGTNFDGCIVDGSTLFDGVQIFRPLARQPAFRFYRVDRGVLIRKEDADVQAVPPELDSATRMAGNSEVEQPSAANSILTEAIDAALAALASVHIGGDLSEHYPEMGHNNPPPEFALTSEDYQSIQSTLIELRASAARGDLQNDILFNAKERLTTTNKKIMEWTAHRINQIQDGFFEQIGTSLADTKFWIGGYVILSGNLDSVLAAIYSIFPG